MPELYEFETFNKIPRLNRDMVVTEKLDGTNAQVSIMTYPPDTFGWQSWNSLMKREGEEEGVTTSFDSLTAANPITALVRNGAGIHVIRAGSRNRWITPGKQTDNYGFAGWVAANAQHVVALGEGRHYGEWWGKGIARGYDQDEKRFSLFNTNRWNDENTPAGIGVVPILYTGPFSTPMVHDIVEDLRTNGSVAAPDFKNPEGVIVFHTALNGPFKVTCVKDESPKGRMASDLAR